MNCIIVQYLNYPFSENFRLNIKRGSKINSEMKVENCLVFFDEVKVHNEDEKLLQQFGVKVSGHWILLNAF